jgi:hypothetical protein
MSPLTCCPPSHRHLEFRRRRLCQGNDQPDPGSRAGLGRAVVQLQVRRHPGEQGEGRHDQQAVGAVMDFYAIRGDTIEHICSLGGGQLVIIPQAPAAPPAEPAPAPPPPRAPPKREHARGLQPGDGRQQDQGQVDPAAGEEVDARCHAGTVTPGPRRRVRLLNGARSWAKER